MVHTGKVTGIKITWGRGKRLTTGTKKSPSKKTDLGAKIAKAVAKSNKSAIDIEAIKAKNLATMRKVSAKAGKARDIEVPNFEDKGVPTYNIHMSREEIDDVLRDQKLIDQVPRYAHIDG